MLTSALAIADYEHGRVMPDRLTRLTHAHYLHYAERMLEVYRRGIGRTRRELHNAVHAVFARESDCPIRRMKRKKGTFFFLFGGKKGHFSLISSKE